MYAPLPGSTAAVVNQLTAKVKRIIIDVVHHEEECVRAMIEDYEDWRDDFAGYDEEDWADLMNYEDDLEIDEYEGE